ncbi:hypothetical protein LguiB_008181 [Lonicera macranthoides]
MSSFNLLLSNTILPVSYLHRSTNLRTISFSIPSNGGRGLACANVEKPNLEKLGLGVSSKKVMKDDSRFFMGTYVRTLVVLSNGKGCKLYDAEGREYLDMTSGISVNAVGHGDPDWVRAVTGQTTVPTTDISWTAPRWFGGCSFTGHVLLSNSGTETNEAAIKFSRKFQQFSHPDGKEAPTEFISFSNSFHGRTMGALALTSKEHYGTQPVMPSVTFLEYGDIDAARELIQIGKYCFCIYGTDSGSNVDWAAQELISTAGKGKVVRLVSPLIISEHELERAVEIMLECLPVLDHSYGGALAAFGPSLVLYECM